MFARFVGRLYWACPACDHVQWHSVNQKTVDVRCKNCWARWLPGMTFWRKPRGPFTIPRDQLLIGEGFVARRLVNRQYCDRCGGAIFQTATAAENPREGEHG